MANYNNKARPVIDYSETIMVNFSISIIQLLDMNIKDQQMTTAIWLDFTCKSWSIYKYFQVYKILFISKVFLRDGRVLKMESSRVEKCHRLESSNHFNLEA